MAIHPRAWLGIGIASALGAAYPASAAAGAEGRIHLVMSSPADLTKARQAGKKAAFFCANCHGEDGNSSYDYIPNLAGQNAVYLLDQVDRFADGRRQDEFMSGLIKVLKDEDRFNMAVYYASQPVRPTPAGNAALAARGRQLYDGTCKACHGADGHGSEKTARLAGQQPAYLKQSLEQYRKGTRLRSDPIMGSVARRLRDDDIAALAAYIPGMK